ncbi:hypothetical protein BO70DRAFT_365775 [Aspergillus heteromorphus CBS 117.55]|uniref:Uncharacterized protein n=1 Tax=Aspergillus heteromorphus CBS 117.55 TaxID=1448321 RepID=A0A317V5D2_9EURO|nr:uncharacterized protein BO70DRAFT_365775 [Aspergillus heteromorphus CBS 117.55]PWY69514.1 hypothetical protein BO70DRAFT_365775 [Aspergillus heteromorphus CBS 117.55]
MSHLYTPGLPYKKAPLVPRFTTQPAFLSFPCPPTARFVFRRNPLVPSYRSFLPVSSQRAGVRSFEEMRKCSHLPVRCVRPPAPRSIVLPAPAPTGAVRSLKGSLSRLEERRAARQARSRPWALPRSQSPNESLEGHRSKLAAIPSKPSPPATHMTRAQRAIKRIDEVLAKSALAPTSAGRKDKSVKVVRFGENTVIPVSRWIVRQEHVYPAPIAAMGHLQGWSVTPLTEPDEDGEMEKYATYWGSDSYVMLTFSHDASRPCNRQDCAWNRLARIAARRPAWGPATVFMVWNRLREQVRERGGFRL